jgi:hypothetical protein
MRTTYIQDLTLKREIPYDPDFHGLIDRKLSLKFEVKSVDVNSAVFEINIVAIFKTKDTQKEMGKISAAAETKITGFDFPLTETKNLDVESMPENLKRVIEGAVFEDLMLHLSTVARYAHLPSLLPIPIIFPRKKTTQGRGKLGKSNALNDISKI